MLWACLMNRVLRAGSLAYAADPQYPLAWSMLMPESKIVDLDALISDMQHLIGEHILK